SRIVSATSAASARFTPTLRCAACLPSHNDIVSGNNAGAQREVSAMGIQDSHNGRRRRIAAVD
ncbi:hypothetical protein JOB18_038593, partial [Solea senegalensis]